MWFSVIPAPGMKNQVMHRQNTQSQGWHDVTNSSLHLRAMKTYKFSSNSSERPRRHLRSYSFQDHRTALPCVDNVAALLTQLTESVSPITQSSSQSSSSILTTLHLQAPPRPGPLHVPQPVPLTLTTPATPLLLLLQPLLRKPDFCTFTEIQTIFPRHNHSVTSSPSPKISGHSSRTSCQSCPIPPHPSPLLSILSSGSVHLHPTFCF